MADLIEGLLELLRVKDDAQLAQARELAMVFSWPLDLRGRDLRGCILSGLASDEIRVEGAIYDRKTVFPWDLRRHSERLIGPRANLRGMDLSGRDLAGVNLSYAMADKHTKLPARYERRDFLGPGGVFVGAFTMSVYNVDLRGARFLPFPRRARWSSGTGSVFSAMQIQQVDLTGAEFVRTHFRHAALVQVNLREARLREACLEKLLTVSVDLRGADLSGARLIEADLRGARLEGACWAGVVADPRTRWPGGRVPSEVTVT